MTTGFRSRNALLVSTALTIATLLPAQAQAAAAEENVGGVRDIVVTAQKREQSVQDVPIAVTAVTGDNLRVNRIFTVNDLSAIAPGVTVKPSAGGISTPAFTIRGQVSFGVVAGSDKQVSVYIDGVYISSPRGSIFQLPDVSRIEVLRGPQGTLFGRNATAGAISVTTRDPTGEMHFRVESSYGNRDAYRVRTTLDTPQFGPFSAIVSYVRDFRHGDIRNAAAGTIWNRTLSPSKFGDIRRSPRFLGSVDNQSYFGALKFEPTDNFKMVYKYDRNDDHGTPEGTAFVAFNREMSVFFPGDRVLGDILNAVYTNQPGPCLAATGSAVCAAPDGKRPKLVSNAWVTQRDQRVQGHNLTATWEANDHITVKNIAAYRKAFVFSPSAIDGVSSLIFPQQALQPLAKLFAFGALFRQGVNPFDPANAALAAGTTQFIAGLLGPVTVGQRFIPIASQASSTSRQWSDELQVNYSSDRLQATLGALYFHSKDDSGGPIGMQNTFVFPSFVPSATGLLPLGKEGRNFNKATSLAAYLQLEYEVFPTLTAVAGGRITYDKKSSRFRFNVRNGDFGIIPGPIQSRPIIVPPNFTKTKPNFLLGLNWQPNPDTLVYGKWSSSFVSGGTTTGIPYRPETASSFEVGIKADTLNRRLRTNLALFYVTYNHFQSPQSTSTPSSVATVLPILTSQFGAATAAELISSLSTFVIDQGKIRARGAELEVTAAPVDGVTVGGSLSYTRTTFPFTNPGVLAGNNGFLDVTARPRWTADVYGSYETEPLFGDATLAFRADGLFQSRVKFALNPALRSQGGLRNDDGSNAAALAQGGFWKVNGRVALRQIDIGGAKAELAVYGKNILNTRAKTFALITGLADSLNFVEARQYGVELFLDF